MPKGKHHTPSFMRRCVADVTAQGNDTNVAFAICNATMQKAGYLTPGPGQEITPKGRKRQRQFSAMKDMKTKDTGYEAALEKGRKKAPKSEDTIFVGLAKRLDEMVNG